MNRKTRCITFALVAGIGSTGLVALAGDLNPPAGPVAPTHKTLTEVEPRAAVNATNTPGDADSLYKITQPGSYYLTGNVTGVAGKHGIEIASSGVTLDLNGFQLIGAPAMGDFDGVRVTVANLMNIAVVNGTVRSWGDDGIDLGTNATDSCRVEGVLASLNADHGIFTGWASSVANCSAYFNMGYGISALSGSTVSNCLARDNTATGIVTGGGCMIANCSVFSNDGNGIATANGCTISNCAANNNTGNGIIVGIGSTASNCSANNNTGDGIAADATGTTVSNCAAYSNTGNGISANDSGCMVTGCTVRYNTLDGILCSSASVIRGNTCSSNGPGIGDGAGIHATGSDNRIEGNNCTGADRGIDVDASGNIIVRNTCSGNTLNWDIAANNKCLVVLGVNAGAISGDSGGVSPGSTDPNANFTY